MTPSRLLFTGWVRLRARQREAILQALELRIDDFERRAVAARDKEDDEATWAAYLRLR